MTAMDLIRTERERQIGGEGWTRAHDQSHGSAVLERAAISYAAHGDSVVPPATWPWDAAYWKPKDALRNLVRAGALFQAAGDAAELIPAMRHWGQRDLVAEQIERLLSAAAQPTESAPR